VWIGTSQCDAGRRCIGTLTTIEETILKLAKQERNWEIALKLKN
jgi:hypothetical protein